MKTPLSVVFILVMFMGPAPLDAGPEAKGASPKALEQASDQAIFHRIPDWFATVGKPEKEKQRILAERRAERRAQQLKKDAEKRSKEAQKAAEKRAEAAKMKMNAAQKDLGKARKETGKKTEEAQKNLAREWKNL